MAGQRNIAKYHPHGDALGPRSPADIRARHPTATTTGIIRSSDRPNIRVTGVGVAGGVLGAAGYVLMVQDVANQIAGRIPITLEGLDPNDFEVGHEFKDVHLGDNVYGTIRVERNIIFRKKFYIVDAYEVA